VTTWGLSRLAEYGLEGTDLIYTGATYMLCPYVFVRICVSITSQRSIERAELIKLDYPVHCAEWEFGYLQKQV